MEDKRVINLICKGIVHNSFTQRYNTNMIELREHSSPLHKHGGISRILIFSRARSTTREHQEST